MGTGLRLGGKRRDQANNTHTRKHSAFGKGLVRGHISLGLRQRVLGFEAVCSRGIPTDTPSPSPSLGF